MKFVIAKNPHGKDGWKVFDNHGRDVTTDFCVTSFKYEVNAGNLPVVMLTLSQVELEVETRFSDMVVTKELALPQDPCDNSDPGDESRG